MQHKLFSIVSKFLINHGEFMKLFVLFFFASILNLSLQNNNLFAQKDEFSKDYFEQVNKIMKEVDEKLIKVLKEDDKNYKFMMSDLQKMMEIEDPKVKKEAIIDYQKKYSSIYSSALKKANVDLNQIAKNFSKMFPDYDISVQNNMIKMKGTSSKYIDIIKSIGSVETIKLDDYEDDSFVDDCLRNQGFVKHENNSLMAYSSAYGANRCGSEATKTLNYTTPKNIKNAKLNINAKFNTIAELIALGGYITSETSAVIYVDNVEERKLIQNLIVPIFWTGLVDDTADIVYEKEYPEDRRIRVVYKTNSYSFCFAASFTEGQAVISDIDTKIKLIK